MSGAYKDDTPERFRESNWNGRECSTAEQSFFIADDQDTWLGLWLVYIGKQPPIEELPEGYVAVSYFLNPEDDPGSTIKFEDRAYAKKIGGENKIVLEFTITEPDKPQKPRTDGKSAYAVKLIPETEQAIQLLCKYRGKANKKAPAAAKKKAAKPAQKKKEA